MKNYNQFLNEVNIGYLDNSNIESYTFFISFQYSEKHDKILVLDKMKEFITDETNITYIVNKISYFWKIELRNFNGKLFIDLDIHPKRGNHENELKCREFLEVGLEGVKDFITKKEEERILRKNINKFNL